ncbi:ImmA/IrrE family metallo-endopeptidase [Martelella lutilitoris]|uniref:ImmA/IrrE family metallo-endopeptidase n=1 Tax=Martelella lutilitoris TaxID=2583532 RepID=A0A7T7HI33_9HYPH|nr:ImmA/IrrE family metallo-endopeptidase [Martelella lutilitoris]QQM29518.1 ImmA/IrrE family metallo-endopeptidase [Martelella lutilitoris]
MVKLLKEANRIITLWREYGPDSKRIDLNIIFREIVLPSSDGDRCAVKLDEFDSFEGMMLRPNDESFWIIAVNSRVLYRPRRNFTFAHEIGHFIGHRKLRRSFRCSTENINDFQSDDLEREANAFAAHVLMPPDIVRDFDERHLFSYEAICELSELLFVSKEAAAYRWVALSRRRIGYVVSRDGFVTKGRASDALFRDGLFFRSGDELPSESMALKVKSGGEILSSEVNPGVWHRTEGCKEDSYAAFHGGYIYTFLDFDE